MTLILALLMTCDVKGLPAETTCVVNLCKLLFRLFRTRVKSSSSRPKVLIKNAVVAVLNGVNKE